MDRDSKREEYEDSLSGSHRRDTGGNPVSHYGGRVVHLPASLCACGVSGTCKYGGVTEEKKPLAKIAKDTAAGAVLFSAIVSVIIGCIIFVPYLLELVRKL